MASLKQLRGRIDRAFNGEVPEKVSELGNPFLDCTCESRSEVTAFLVMGGACFCGGSLLTAFLVYIVINVPNSETLAALIILVGTLITLTLSGLCTWGAYRHHTEGDDLLILCKKGLFLRKDGKVAAYYWDEILAITLQQVNFTLTHTGFVVQQGESDVYVLKTRKRNHEIRTHDSVYLDMREFADEVVRHTYPHVLNRCVKRFNANELVEFGVFRVDREGIDFGKRLLKWKHFEDIDVRRGIVTLFELKNKKAWAKVETGKVDNLALFVDLCDYIRRNGGEKIDLNKWRQYTSNDDDD